MDLLSRLDGWPALLARLRLGSEAPAALLELELAFPPLMRGWQVDLSPSTQPGRFADLRISRGQKPRQRIVFIEASIVDDFSLHARDDMSFQKRLVPYLELHLEGLEVGGRLHIDPDLEQEDELLALATDFWQRCRQHRLPDELVIRGVLELWAVPAGDQKAKQSMIARGHQDGFVGGVADNPLKRVLRAVRAKLGQLPLDEPGLIVLQPPSMLFRSFPLEVIVATIRQRLAASPAVAGVGLIQWIITDGKRVTRVRNHPSGLLVVTVPDRLIWLKQLGLVINPAHKTKGSVSFVTELI